MQLVQIEPLSMSPSDQVSRILEILVSIELPNRKRLSRPIVKLHRDDRSNTNNIDWIETELPRQLKNSEIHTSKWRQQIWIRFGKPLATPAIIK